MDEIELIREKKRQEMLKGTAQGAEWPSEPVDVTDDTLNEFIKKYPMVLVDCWAPWCGPCRMMTPVIDKLAKDHAGKVAFAKINVDQNQKVVQTHKIMAIPTLLFVKDGKVVDQIVGLVPKEEIEDAIRKNF
jgi:thioredoxin 1